MWKNLYQITLEKDTKIQIFLNHFKICNENL